VSCHFVQEPYSLRGHHAGLFPSILHPSLSGFTYFPAFVSSAYKRDLAKKRKKKKEKGKEKEILHWLSSPASTIRLSHTCICTSAHLSALNPLPLSYSTPPRCHEPTNTSFSELLSEPQECGRLG
jgi:hypothetical protein